MPASRRNFGVIVAAVAAVAVVIGGVATLPEVAYAGPSVQTQTFSYTGSPSTFTVPAGITSLGVTVVGAEGGQGGADASGPSPTGGYQGVVTGNIPVTPGAQLTIGVGQGGASGANTTTGSTDPAHYTDGAAVGGTNPVGGYAGGDGGEAGYLGDSGDGGAGGGATVITSAAGAIVAGGAGGSGGSGQFPPTLGRVAGSTFTGRTDSTTTTGQTGITVATVCGSAGQCDGGSSGGGGGGAQGGAQGQIQFGSGSSDEWYGYGGSPGENSTAGLSGLTAYYSYYSDNNEDGSVTFTWEVGAPAVPTAVSGTAANGAANLIWTAPTDQGQGAVTDYVIQYAAASSPTSWTTFADGVSTDTSATVTGLTNGVGYVFQVAAVNSIGTGAYSDPSATVTPQGVPAAPTNVVANSADGALSVSFTAPATGATVTGYDYRVGAGLWVSSGSTTSPLVIPGLVNGTAYSVSVRAESVVGAGSASAPVTGTPEAVAGAPTITALAAGPTSITVSFTPGFDGGSGILDYDYQLNNGAWHSAVSASSPFTITGVGSGSTYSIAIAAVNGEGLGAASVTSSITTPSLPGAPSISSVTAGDGTAAITFTAGDTGGSPITDYEYQLASGGSWVDAETTSSPILISGLTNGTGYSVSLRADNEAGAGVASTPQAFTPATTPAAPTINGSTIAGSDSQLDADFTAPDSDGGSAITSYQYSTDGGATWATRLAGTTDSPLVISTLSSDGVTPLVDGQTYFVELRAVNAVGAGAASAYATGIARTTPSAPSISSVVAGPGELSVAFSPASNGGAAITEYDYQVGSGAWTSTGTLGTSFVIQGLTDGQPYAVRVRASNSQGDGDASAGATGTPVDVPGQPAIGSVVRSDQTLTATVALASDGGSAITAWQYSTDGGTTWSTATGTASPLVLTTLSSGGARLSNGTGYALQVRAVNAIGTSAASSTTTVAPSTSPAAPALALTPGNQSVSVAFSLGADGGSPVSAIEYSENGGLTWINAGTLSSPFTIANLTNGTQYQIEVRANNPIGDGAASDEKTATPSTTPGSPANVAAVSDTSSADVSWDAPSDGGGSAVIDYTASAYATSTSTVAIAQCITTDTDCSIGGLANLTSYYVSVTAQNANGAGAASTPRVIVTPRARPSAPSLESLTPGDTNLSLAFDAGAAGSDPITGYQYELNGGDWQNAPGTTSPIVIPNLTDGTSYTVALRAVSAAGVGVSSDTLTSTPFTYPDAPDSTTILGNAGNGRVAVSWAAADLNGGTLSQYVVTAFSAAEGGSQGQQCTSAGLSCTITGLTNGVTYYLSIQTENTLSMLSVRSDPRVAVTPSLTPGAPTGVTGTAGDGQVSLNWAAPVSTGASAISDYTVWYSANGGSYIQFADGTSTATSATITGLTNGTPYTFEIRAVNASGSSDNSVPSSAMTPLAPGTLPVLTGASSTATGYTFAISNYDSSSSAQYTVSATNGATATRVGGTVTVTGLTDGASATTTVQLAKLGFTTLSSTVSGSALLTGIAPSFTGITRTPDGFTVGIANYDSGSVYSISASSGSVSRNGATITVTGLAPGASSTVDVTVNKTGCTAATGSPSGSAMSAGPAPIFGPVTETATGFTFAIANYDSNLTYTFGATDGAQATEVAGLVTVTGLVDGSTSTVTVTATDPGTSTGSSTLNGLALLSGDAPAVSNVTQTADGFSFDFVASGAFGYTASATEGVVTLDGSTVTVTGLAPGEESVVSLTASADGYTDASTSVDATALLAGVQPQFGTVTRTADGYSFEITNPDPDATYSVSATGGAAVALDGSTVTVTGLSAGTDSVVTVTVDRSGYTEATNSQDGQALAAGIVPVLNDVTATPDGFSFVIANYLSTLQYTFASSAFAVVSQDGATVTVSGILPGVWSTVTITATDPQVSIATGQTGGTSLVAGTVPHFTAAVPTAGGYTFSITNYSPVTSYSFAESNGGTASQMGAAVAVTGLGAGVYSLTTVTAELAGAVATSNSQGGTSLPDGNVAAISGITQTDSGFIFSITNYDASNTYTVTSDAGTVVETDGTVTVSGLALGASTTVHITTSQPGVLDETADVTGTAIAAGVAPTFSAASPVTGGFVFTITNYSAGFSYAFAAPAGVGVTNSGARVTVVGLAPAAPAAVTVTAKRGGYEDASATEHGNALGLAAPPAQSAPAQGPVAPAIPVVTEDVTPHGHTSSTSSAPSELEPGSGAVFEGSKDLHSTLVASGNGVTLRSGGLSMQVAVMLHGKLVILRAGTTILVKHGGKLQIIVRGFLPGSIVTVWAHSTPIQLGAFTVGPTGMLSRTIALPKALKAGSHMLEAEGTAGNKSAVNMRLGFRIEAAQQAVAATASTWWWWLIVLALLMATVVAFFVMRVSRRRA